MNDPNGITRYRMERVERDLSDLARRTTVNDEWRIAVASRLDAMEKGIDNCAKDSQRVRAWVEEQLKQAEKEEAEERRLSATAKVAIIGAVAVVIASVIAAIASLVAAGVLG